MYTMYCLFYYFLSNSSTCRICPFCCNLKFSIFWNYRTLICLASDVFWNCQITSDNLQPKAIEYRSELNTEYREESYQFKSKRKIVSRLFEMLATERERDDPSISHEVLPFPTHQRKFLRAPFSIIFITLYRFSLSILFKTKLPIETY